MARNFQYSLIGNATFPLNLNVTREYNYPLSKGNKINIVNNNNVYQPAQFNENTIGCRVSMKPTKA